MRRPRNSLQPAPVPAGVAATRSRPHSQPRTGSPGPDRHRLAATGDHPGNALVDVGADFFTAAELAELELDALPLKRQSISQRATRDGWKHRARQGRGGGREFALADLPADARAEILQRRILEQAATATGTNGAKRAPRATIAALSHKQATRHSARTLLLDTFDTWRGQRSARAMLDLFVAAFNRGDVELPSWAREQIGTVSRRTLERWCGHRSRGADETLAGRWAGGRQSVFGQSRAAADFIVGAHAAQPLMRTEELQGLLATRFPQGVPDENGLLLEIPSIATVGRFLKTWRADPANAAAYLAFVDPDRNKSHHRFAAGDASAAITALNERWEIDASPADALCTDGRMNLYVVVDVATRRLRALVSNTPQTNASLLMIARACQAWGVPRTIGTDNGSDFKSAHFRAALRQLGVAHKLAPRYSPERKPFVERAIGSIQHKFMPLLPGYVGANVADRTKLRARQAFAQRLGVSDEDAFAVAISSVELQEQLDAWLANIYEQRPHSGLSGRTPHEVAMELAAAQAPVFADPAAIGMLLMPPARGGTRVVGKEGITIDGVDYWVERLIPGQRLQVRLDPADAGRIYLYTDTDPWRFIGIGVNPDLAGLDRAELAGRMRADQAIFEREGRAQLRKLARAADIHSVARRMIGQAPVPIAANTPTEWSTPALDEALRAANRADTPLAIAELTGRRREHADEETSDQRYARAKRLRALVDAGQAIAAESLQWLEGYEVDREYLGLKLVEDTTG